jgi:hypothetical protein
MHSDQEKAAFEAGIKLGALYHQWVGTPISSATASGIEDAIASAVALQPFVTGVDVTLNRAMMTSNVFGYSELSGLMLEVTVTTRVGQATCQARLHQREGYPLMEIIACGSDDSTGPV